MEGGILQKKQRRYWLHELGINLYLIQINTQYLFYIRKF